MTIEYLYSKFVKKFLKGKAILNSRIDSTSVIYSGCHIVNCDIGKYSYVSYDSSLLNTEVGNFCSIATKVSIGASQHPISWVSTSPVFENIKNSGPRKRFARFDVDSPKRTIIGSDVWIGHSATIKSGVKIGHGAIIGACALVTKDVPPYAVVGGVPAKVIKFRFPQEEISKLLKLEWWNLSDELLQQCANEIKSPYRFIEKIEKLKNYNK